MYQASLKRRLISAKPGNRSSRMDIGSSSSAVRDKRVTAATTGRRLDPAAVVRQPVKMSSGRNADTRKLGTSTSWLILRSTATLQMA
jgi:hypothetical protein